MGINILRRFNLYAPSTPYSSARSNIDHFLHLERTNYVNFLDSRYHFTAKSWTKSSVYLSEPISSNLFNQGPRPYFEFSHHNPAVHEERLLLSKRVKRFLDYRDSLDEKVFFYHHRSNNGFNQKVINHLFNGFKSIQQLYSHSYFLCFTQHIINDSSQRGFRFYSPNPSIIFFNLYTLKPWAGNNLDNFFARKR